MAVAVIRPGLLGDIAVAGLGVYLFFVFLKQGLRREREGRSFWLVLGLVVLPLLAAVHYLGRWSFDPAAGWNALDRWWCLRIPPPEGEDGPPSAFNLITGGLVIALLYTAATLLVGLFSRYYHVRRGSHMLAIHKVLVKLAVVLVGLTVYLKGQDISLTPLWVGMGAASIVVGIALQEPLANLFTGVALDLEGAFKRNDWIRVGGKDGIAGKVVEKNWRTTKLVTIDHELVVIPNRSLGSEVLLNYHQPAAAHAHLLYVGTSYQDPPVKVKEVLRTILVREPRILKEPDPQVRTIRYNDFSIDYELKFWIDDYGEHPEIKNAVMTQIWYAFKFFGIEIPFPIRTIHAKARRHLVEEEGARSERHGEVSAFLQSLPFLNEHLTHKDFDFLAHNCFTRFYRAGEHVVTRGELGDAIFIVRDRWCEVLLPDGRTRRIEAGEYFGEMGLLSLRPRTATVAAGEEGSTVIKVDRECMEALFRRYPRLKEEVVRVRDHRLDDTGITAEMPEEEPRTWARRIARGVREFLVPW
jgi:small-conductance mechanosensitive channel